MSLLTKLLQTVPMKKMRLVPSSSSSSAAMMVKQFAANACYSTAASVVEEKIWLMLPSHEANNEGPSGLHKLHDSCFYDIRSKSFVTSNLQNQKPETNKDKETPRIVGSSHGFLALLNPRDCSLSLAKIPPRFQSSSPRLLKVHDLPGLDTLPEFLYPVFCESEYNHKYGKFQVAGFAMKKGFSAEDLVTSKRVVDNFVNKIVMSDPRSGDVNIVMSLSRWGKTRLAFCQGFHAERWNVLDTRSALSDVMYSSRDNKFYGVRDSYDLQIEVWDLKNPASPEQKIFVPRPSVADSGKLWSDLPSKFRTNRRYYLVESTSGEILLVVRHQALHVLQDGHFVKVETDPKSDLPYGTYDFDVFKLSPSGKLHRVENFNGEALFVGINHSFAVCCQKFPGIKGNSIYFSDHYPGYNDRSSSIQFDISLFDRSNLEWEWPWTLPLAGRKDYAYGGHDCGRFNLKNKSVRPCYPTQSKKRMQHPPVWVAPTSYLTKYDQRRIKVPILSDHEKEVYYV